MKTFSTYLVLTSLAASVPTGSCLAQVVLDDDFLSGGTQHYYVSAADSAQMAAISAASIANSSPRDCLDILNKNPYGRLDGSQTWMICPIDTQARPFYFGLTSSLPGSSYDAAGWNGGGHPGGARFQSFMISAVFTIVPAASLKPLEDLQLNAKLTYQYLDNGPAPSSIEMIVRCSSPMAIDSSYLTLETLDSDKGSLIEKTAEIIGNKFDPSKCNGDLTLTLHATVGVFYFGELAVEILNPSPKGA